MNAEVAAWMRRDRTEDGFASPPFLAMGDGKSVMWNRQVRARVAPPPACFFAPRAGPGDSRARACAPSRALPGPHCAPPLCASLPRQLSVEKWVNPIDRFHAMSLVGQALQEVGASRLVVGHTPQVRAQRRGARGPRRGAVPGPAAEACEEQGGPPFHCRHLCPAPRLPPPPRR
jgi:hypothetical protein